MQLPSSNLWRSDSAQLFALTEDDVNDCNLAWMNDPLVVRFFESRFERHTHDSLLAFVQHAVARRGELLLGIRSVALQGRHVGNIKVGTINWNHRIGDIGIMIGEFEALGPRHRHRSDQGGMQDRPRGGRVAQQAATLPTKRAKGPSRMPASKSRRCARCTCCSRGGRRTQW